MYGIYVTKVLALGAIAGIPFVLFMLIMLFLNKKLSKDNVLNQLYYFFRDYAILFSFLISSFGVLISLFYSEIMHYLPCELCWFQRIFIYPMPILLFIGMIKKSGKDIIHYVLPFPVIALIIGIYQYMLQFGKVADILNCGVEGGLPSCASYYVLQYGFITIPFMGIVSMSMIIVMLIAAKNK